MRLDEEQLFRDDLAERRRERDREREPQRFRRPVPDLRTRQSFQARQIDLVNQAAVDASVTAIECPACVGPVFAPADSDNERIDCLHCDARLVTHRSIGGEVTAILVDGVGP